MFSLQIVNFKSWKEKNIKLEFDNGIILISGESGRGKTSVLQAIEFAITGKGKKIIRRGSKSCSVYLNFSGIEITRTKGPNRLQVTVDDITLEDADAQCEIDKKFGKDFTMTSFIKQKSSKSFLNLTPKDKTLVIRRNCLTELNNVKENCDDSLREAKATMRDHSVSIEQLHSVLEGIEKPEEVINTKLTGKKERYLKQLIQSLTIKISNRDTRLRHLTDLLHLERDKYQIHKNNIKNNLLFESSIIEIKSEIQSLGDRPDKEMVHTVEFLQEEVKNHKKADLFRTQTKSYDEMKEEDDCIRKSKIQEIESNILDTKSKLSQLTPISRMEITEACKNAQKSKIWHEWCIQNTLPDLYSKSLSECINPLDEQIANLNKKKTRYLCLRESKKCPECKTTIVLTNEGDLIKGEYKLDDNLQMGIYDKKITIVNSKVNKLKGTIRDINKLYFECSKSPEEYEAIYKDLVKNDEEYSNYSEHLTSLDAKLARCNVINPTLEKMKKKLDHIERTMNDPTLELCEAEKMLEEARYYTERVKKYDKELGNLHKRLTQSQSRIVSDSTGDVLSGCELKIDSIEKDITRNESERIVLQLEKSEAGSYLEYITRKTFYDNVHTKFEEAKEKLDIAGREYKCLIRLGKIITKAESITMSNYIRTLNVYIDEYMTVFFPSVSMKAAISSFKTDSKSCVKHQVTVIVYHGSEEVDVNSLSGGEYDRLQLAITMAMSRVSNSPIMMLDESISSLDEATCNIVLKGIKTNTELSKLVLIVAHQFIEGNFDSTIEI